MLVYTRMLAHRHWQRKLHDSLAPPQIPQPHLGLSTAKQAFSVSNLLLLPLPSKTCLKPNSSLKCPVQPLHLLLKGGNLSSYFLKIEVNSMISLNSLLPLKPLDINLSVYTLGFTYHLPNQWMVFSAYLPAPFCCIWHSWSLPLSWNSTPLAFVTWFSLSSSYAFPGFPFLTVFISSSSRACPLKVCGGALSSAHCFVYRLPGWPPFSC